MMTNSGRTDRNSLPKLQKFLLDKKLVAVNKTSYFAYWVSRFLSFAVKQSMATDECHEAAIAAIIDGLRAQTRASARRAGTQIPPGRQRLVLAVCLSCCNAFRGSAERRGTAAPPP